MTICTTRIGIPALRAGLLIGTVARSQQFGTVIASVNTAQSDTKEQDDSCRVTPENVRQIISET